MNDVNDEAVIALLKATAKASKDMAEISRDITAAHVSLSEVIEATNILEAQANMSVGQMVHVRSQMMQLSSEIDSADKQLHVAMKTLKRGAQMIDKDFDQAIKAKKS